jgi:hypothetical protein
VSDLTLSLNALTFDELVNIGRAMIPTLAPRWTDHNIHDPGIMLMELMAWIAEAQMYSMDRLRRDERTAYAALLGVQPRGPLPARGLVWPPVDSTPWTEGFIVKQGSAISPDRIASPTFFASYDLQLTAARLTRVETKFADGTSHDWTLVNAQQSATYMPFGDAAQPDTRLVLTFQGTPVNQSAAAPLSLGWEIETDSKPAQTPKAAPSNLEITVSDADGDRRLQGVVDTTGGLLQSGVLLFSPGRIVPEHGKFRLTLRSLSGGLPRPPRVRRIGLNVVPMEQVEQVQDPSGSFGLAMPNQQYSLAEDGFVFSGTGSADLQITTLENGQPFTWILTGDLQNSGPNDRHFQLDPSTGTVTFGNGVNGMLLPSGAPIQAQYKVCAGASGNLQPGMKWSIEGVAGAFGSNPEPTSGGLDATTLDDLRDEARIDADEDRPLVTADDVEKAAKSFSDLGVTRAVEMLYDASQPPGSRLLIVAGPHDSAGPTPDLAESREFLRAIQRRIMPRLPLGQTMRVEAPKYVPVKISATVTAARNANPADVHANCLAELRKRVAIVTPDGVGQWPMGRPVTSRSVQGWLRKVSGVAQVVSVNVSAAQFGPSSLPDLQVSPSDIIVNRPGGGAR